MPEPKTAPGSKGHQALHDLEGTVVRLQPGVEPDVDPKLYDSEEIIGDPGGQDDERAAAEQDEQRSAGGVKQRQEQEKKQHCCAQVTLPDQDHDRDEPHQQDRTDHARSQHQTAMATERLAAQDRVLLGQITGEKGDQDDLEQFRGLKGDRLKDDKVDP